MLGRQGELRIAALSHDLRTPVTSVVALTQLALEEQRQGRGVEKCLGELLIAAHALESIAGDLAVSGDEDKFTGAELERELLVLAAPRAQEKAQRLTVDLGALRALCVMADRSALERILVNLLTNAIKYTREDGEISLTADVRPGAEESVNVTFVVRDNGMGMKRDFLRRLYQPYARAREAVACHIPGTGMGLAIVRRLVERMHGAIKVRSKWGEGTAFTVCVPMRLGHPAERVKEETREDRACLAGKRLLLAEDNALCARIARQLLSGAKAEVEIAGDGEEAVRLFARRRFDAVVMDMRMPGMDGCAAAQAIRKREPRGRHVPIVAMTAGQPQDREEALRAGMDDCLLKPLEVDRLARTLKACWEGTQS